MPTSLRRLYEIHTRMDARCARRADFIVVPVRPHALTHLPFREKLSVNFTGSRLDMIGRDFYSLPTERLSPLEQALRAENVGTDFEGDLL